MKSGTNYGPYPYGFNSLIFSKENGINFTNPPTANGKSYDPEGRTRFVTIRDGTSNTLLIAHRYALCGTGGTAWAYSALSTPSLPAPMQAPPKQIYPGFQISFFGGTAVGPASQFQLDPTPAACDPLRAASPHSGVMPVCLADCSVRTVSGGMSPTTWWFACTFSGGEAMPSDWND